MTSPYLNRPTRQWCEAECDSIATTQTVAGTLRTAIEGAEHIARTIRDRCRDGDSLARADEMVQMLSDLLPDYLKPLEDALQEDYEAAQHEQERAI